MTKADWRKCYGEAEMTEMRDEALTVGDLEIRVIHDSYCCPKLVELYFNGEQIASGAASLQETPEDATISRDMGWFLAALEQVAKLGGINVTWTEK